MRILLTDVLTETPSTPGLEALKVVNIAAEKAEEYAVANKSEDVKAIIASGFIDNLRSAYLEYAAANDIIKNDVTIERAPLPFLPIGFPPANAAPSIILPSSGSPDPLRVPSLR